MDPYHMLCGGEPYGSRTCAMQSNPIQSGGGERVVVVMWSGKQASVQAPHGWAGELSQLEPRSAVDVPSICDMTYPRRRIAPRNVAEAEWRGLDSLFGSNRIERARKQGRARLTCVFRDTSLPHATTRALIDPTPACLECAETSASSLPLLSRRRTLLHPRRSRFRSTMTRKKRPNDCNPARPSTRSR